MIIPKHVAIIMDGNGRWGLKKKKSRKYGHIQGIKVLKKIINAALKKNIKYLTLYAFSTENWKRPQLEIKFLLKLLEKYLDKESKLLIDKDIKIKIIGSINKFPIKLRKKIKKIVNLTKKKNRMQVNIALNYGSRNEILHAMKCINKKSLPINEVNLSKFLYTKCIPDPEIIIRTGNTKRLSNFLLWQSIYSEIFFEKKLWPDFNERDFDKIIIKYNKIRRNFGDI
jgi:undecaprenyl diphosphate synthase